MYYKVYWVCSRQAPWARHCCKQFTIGLRAPMANSRKVCFNLILSLRQSSVFQCTTYYTTLWVDFEFQPFILHFMQHFHLGSGAGCQNFTFVLGSKYQYILVLVVHTWKKNSFLTHPDWDKGVKSEFVQLLCMGYNVTKSSFKNAQVKIIPCT